MTVTALPFVSTSVDTSYSDDGFVEDVPAHATAGVTAMEAVDLAARLIGEEVGRMTPAQPVEVLLTTLAVRLRDEVWATARMAGYTDSGADLLRGLADTLARMAPAMADGTLENRSGRGYR